jgi:hypothetical protein
MYQVPTNELFPILLLMLIAGYIERGNEEDSIVNCEFNFGLSTDLVYIRCSFPRRGSIWSCRNKKKNDP